jgi:hypothetical protein
MTTRRFYVFVIILPLQTSLKIWLPGRLPHPLPLIHLLGAAYVTLQEVYRNINHAELQNIYLPMSMKIQHRRTKQDKGKEKKNCFR